jgi:hypothetical protein
MYAKEDKGNYFNAVDAVKVVASKTLLGERNCGRILGLKNVGESKICRGFLWEVWE